MAGNIIAGALGTLGAVSLGLGALIWFGLADNTDAQGLAQLVAIVPLGIGALLMLGALIAWVL